MTYNEQTAEWERRAQEIVTFIYDGPPAQVGPGTVRQKIVDAQRDAVCEALLVSEDEMAEMVRRLVQ